VHNQNWVKLKLRREDLLEILGIDSSRDLKLLKRVLSQLLQLSVNSGTNYVTRHVTRKTAILISWSVTTSNETGLLNFVELVFKT
jgi:hypothetical protein